MTSASSPPKTGILIVELVLLFVGVPLAFRFRPFPLPPLPVLWAVTLYCLYRLRIDPSFERRLLWNLDSLRAHIGPISATFALLASCIGVLVYEFRPDLLFNFVHREPLLWAVVMVLYPLLSVYPQGIIFRAYFVHRFRPLFSGENSMILASAAAFAFMHIVFRNPIAVVYTFAGGVLFARRYYRSGSLLVSSLEHALYGCWMFTVGLGPYFYQGAR
jgi:uncharacterized protein